MKLARKIIYGIGGFALSSMTAISVALVLQYVFAAVWTPPLTFVATYGTALAAAITAIGSTWVYLLQRLNNAAIIRGVWCHVYAVFGIAVVSLVASLFV